MFSLDISKEDGLMIRKMFRLRPGLHTEQIAYMFRVSERIVRTLRRARLGRLRFRGVLATIDELLDDWDLLPLDDPFKNDLWPSYAAALSWNYFRAAGDV